MSLFPEISLASLLAFLGVIAFVVVAWLWMFPASHRRQAAIWSLVWLAVTGLWPVVIWLTSAPPEAQAAGFFAMLGIVLYLALSRVGGLLAGAVPLAVLIAVQVFRLPLELVLDDWNAQGYLPVQMTFHGDNLDIVTGILALPVAALVWRGVLVRPLGIAFNLLGLWFLARIIWIVNLSSPTPLRAAIGGYEGGPDVLMGLQVPMIWIASVAVSAAIFLHLVALRQLFGNPGLRTEF